MDSILINPIIQELALVKEIDEKMIQLTEEVMEQEKKSVHLMDIIGEIKGLLINIYVVM